MRSLPKQLFQACIATAEGTFVATYSSEGLCALEFPEPGKPVADVSESVLPPQVRSWHGLTVTSVRNVLSGRASGKVPPLDLSSATEFQRNVWAALRQIEPGQTRSYGEVALAIARPKATRAVGAACGANPIPLLIPCHRVLAANQKLGGFSAGLEWKRLLLSREQSLPRD